ncbi:MAG: SAM-dependent methyltransferase [Firmicutes bacterium]|nr:SAM-dependent methyltransferase [Bacillota bacterium]
MVRRVESKTSRTAEFTCLGRALSYTEKRLQYKSDDYVSMVIVNSLIKLLIRIPIFRRRLIKVFPAGMYEYVISRTKYIDSEFKRALEEGVEQVLIFGAGFDSRGVRFQDISKKARVFELDVPVTQTAKIKRYEEKEIKTPENLVFVPIDFETQSIAERLMESGFKKGAKSLFLLEGLTMYLQPESVDKTFKTIREMAGGGSRVVFDHIYASVLRRENRYEGETELYRSVSKENEGFRFGIENGGVTEFLAGYGLTVLSIMDSDALEDMFFKDNQGKPLARVNGTHCIVTAVS